MKTLNLFLPVCLLCMVSACAGFEPLYAQNTTMRRGLEQLSAEPIDGRAGFLFSQALQNGSGITTGKSGKYVLSTVLNTQRSNVGVRIDAVSTRARLSMTARYTVRDQQGHTLYQGSTYSDAAYDVPDQPYGALAAEQAAEETAAKILSEKVINDLAVFFAGMDKVN